MKITANRLCVLAAAWIVLTANHAFWKLLFTTYAADGESWTFAVSLAVALIGLNLLLLRVLTPGRSIRYVLSLLLLLTAAASWFMDSYGIEIDSGMIRNVAQTNVAEAREYLGLALLWHLAWQAGLPIAFVWYVRLPASTWLHSLRDYVVAALAGVALLLASALPMYASYASFFRNQHGAGYLLAPGNVLVGSISVLRANLHVAQPYLKVGEDARRETVPRRKPLLIVLVVGETARAANFSLGGYARDTNPMLVQKGVFYFSNARSCGTATAVSLPCMFSGLPRREFKLADADRRDTVLDVLQRAGVGVTWIDNQSGCKGVCARVQTRVAKEYHPQSCSDGECLDDDLLFALAAQLSSVNADAVVVLHAMGSHGPAYYRRVPPDHERFTPICPTERFERCTDQQIVNSYDNSIAFTDYVLSGLIDELASEQARFDSVLLYVSDHGESLGEGGIYLHGQPYLVAPDVQTRVPLLFWFSTDAPARLKLDTRCLRSHLDDPVSHDHLAHTLLGLSDVATKAYRPELDLLRTCRGSSA